MVNILFNKVNGENKIKLFKNEIVQKFVWFINPYPADSD